MKKNKDKVLVTGGAGFLGSHLCDLLLSKGKSVICLDNLLTGSSLNIKHLLKNKDFLFFKLDVTKSSFRNVFQTFDGVKYIFHLASPASPIDYWRFPEETLLVNSIGAINMLEMARSIKAKILMASTSEIYGDPLLHPQKETYFGNVNTFGPRSCYDESKRFSESATYVYIHKYDIDARITRIFNTYGPRMKKNDGRVVSTFINQALAEKPLTIDGNGSQTRSFCYVSDLVDGIYRAMFRPKARGEIFNLGNSDEFTILELAKMTLRLTGSKSKIRFSKRFRKDDPMRRKPDITKAKEILFWKPKVKLLQGLEKTIQYYKDL
jgi:dTDP-glucose 4,6-dehydratase